MFVLQSILNAYLPRRILILHDGRSVEEVVNMLSRAEIQIDKVNMGTRLFSMPDLFVAGNPVYSHIVIYGDNSYLSKQDVEAIAHYADGLDDPVFSRRSKHEKETLPNMSEYTDDATTKRFSKIFEPYPGASLMIITSNESFKNLLSKVGMAIQPMNADKVVLEQARILENAVNYKNIPDIMPDGLLVSPSFKNKRNTFIPLLTKGNSSIAGMWRGVRNNVRMLFVGSTSVFDALEKTDLSSEQQKAVIQFTYDLFNWFTWQTDVIRPKHFNHSVVDLPTSSPCRQALHLAATTQDHVREGNLVLIELSIDQMTNRQWNKLKPAKTYSSFEDMVEQVGYPKLTNKNFTSVLKQQSKSFKANYDKCLKEALGDMEYVYTDIQAFESFVQDWYVVNMVQDVKTGKFYALLQPDLVRSFSIQVDIDYNYFNRVNIVQRIHAYVDRFEDNKFTPANSVWQVCLALTVALSVIAVFVILCNHAPVPRIGDQKED